MPFTHSLSLEVDIALHLGVQVTKDVIMRILDLTSSDEAGWVLSRPDRPWMEDCLSLRDVIAVSSPLPVETPKLPPSMLIQLLAH